MLSLVTFNINGGKKLLDSFFETNIENKSDENQKKLRDTKISPDLIFLIQMINIGVKFIFYIILKRKNIMNNF